MACDIDTLVKLKESLLAKGYTEEQASAYIKLFAMKNSEKGDTLSKIIETTVGESSALNETEKTDLKNMFAKLITRVEDTVGSVTNLSDRIDKTIEKLLSVDEKERIYKYLSRIQIASGNIEGQPNNFIDVLKDTIAIHKAKGNLEIASSLESQLQEEQKKVDKFEKDRTSRLTDRDRQLIKLENLKKIAELAQAVAAETLTADELKQIQTIQESTTKLSNLKNKVNTLKAEVTSIKAELTKLPKDVAKLLPKSKEARKNLEDKLVETKKNLKEAEKELNLAKTADELLPKDILKRKDTLTGTLKTIQKEIIKAREQINKIDGKEFGRVVTKVRKNLTEQASREAKSLRDIRSGYKQRVDLINSYFQQLEELMGKDTRIDLAFLITLIGQTAVQNTMQMRDKVKLDDGTYVEDTSPLTLTEALDATKRWRNTMINGVHNGFYSTDLAVLNDENFNYLKAIATGQEIVDLSDPNVLDAIIVPTRTIEDAISQTTIGTTPEGSRAKSAKELSTWLNSTIATLESLRSASNFKGTINEAFLRIALHQNLFHVSSGAFASALKKTRKKRNIQTSSTDNIETKKRLLKELGLDPSQMPEYNQEKYPDWENDFSKLVSYDIETDGNTEDSITMIKSIQITIYDGGTRVTKLFMNSNNTLVDGIKEPLNNVSGLTQEQLQSVLQSLENYQNNGYKVTTWNGNNFDFKHLKKFGVDPKLLTRVALRSQDLLANLGFDNKVPAVLSGSFRKKSPKGARLKEVGQNNLPNKANTAFDGKITFTNGSVLFNKSVVSIDDAGNENVSIETEELSGDNIGKYWKEGNETGDWTKFIAYAMNDTELTTDLALHFAKQDATEVKIVTTGSLEYYIKTTKPRTNLFLDETLNSDGELTFVDIIEPILNNVPEISQTVESIYYAYELEYDLDTVINTLQDWLLQAWSIDPDNKQKLEFISQGLETQQFEKTQVEHLIIELSQKNRKALQILLKKKFNEFGYIDQIANQDGTLPTSLFTINQVESRASLRQELMFDKLISEQEYENRILEHMSEFINDKAFVNKSEFDTILRNKFGIRSRQLNETDASYYLEAMNIILSKYLGDYKRLSDFGNGNIDWKPAYEIGIALAQLVMDKRPGITQLDNILINGETITNSMLLTGTAMVYQGRAKNFIIPDKGRVSFISPFSPQDEERSYDNFRLINRIKFALSYDFSDPTKLDEFMTWAQTPQEMNRTDAISHFASAVNNTVFPDTRSRSPFDNLMTLNERKQLAYSYMFNIPRLLTCFNHDCAYWGINAGGRFLTDELPVYYLDDFMSAGAPTARTTLAGAIDQIAFMSVFNLNTPMARQRLLDSIVAGTELLRQVKDPEKLMQMTNKSDYKYSGLHLTTAAFNWYQDANFSVAYQILSDLGIDINMDEERIVTASGLNDPRYKAIDLMVEDLALLKDNREAYKQKFRLTDRELDILEKTLGKMTNNRDDAKEYLKGAVTPRFFRGGFKGIFEGLLNKSKEKNLNYSIEETKVITKVLLRQLVNQHMTMIDQAIGISQKTIDEVGEIFLTRLNPTIKPENMKATFNENFFGEMDYDARRKQMQVYFDNYVNQLSESLVPKFGLENRKAQVEDVREQLVKLYSKKMDEAAALFTSVDQSKLNAEEFAQFQTKVNQILAGSVLTEFNKDTKKIVIKPGQVKRGADQHLVLWALNRRAATPFKLLFDNLEKQRASTGVHITTDDFEQLINKTIFHTYGVELASGRNHMFGGWGNGPESSKLAQVRVVGGKEANELGIWDIQDVKWSEEEFNKLFATQLMLDLLPYYALPNYDKNTESRESYWNANEQRSIQELEAQAFIDWAIKQPESAGPIGKTGMTGPQIKQNVEKYAGLPIQRFRLRTLAGDALNKDNLMSMDNSVEGLGSYRPMHADRDFTQRSIFSLLEVQHRIKLDKTREKQLQQKIKDIQAKPIEDPNDIIPKEHRGFVSIFDKKDLPLVPAQTTDVESSIIIGPKTVVEQKAIKLKNRLQAFAKLHGWEELLDKKDWTRLFLLSELHYKAYGKALKTFEDSSETETTSYIEAKVAFIDGFFKTLGIKSKAFLKGKNFSTVDLMLRKEDLAVSAQDIKYLKDRFPEGVSWLQTLVYLSDRLDRLQGIKFGVVLEPGIVVRGGRGLVKNPTRAQPNNIHNLEVLVLYNAILASEAFRKAATSYLKAKEPGQYAKAQKDSNGYVLLESIGIEVSKQMIMDIVQLGLQNKTDLASELNKKFLFVVNGLDIKLIPFEREQVTKQTGPISVEVPGMGLVKINSTVDNPNTLWAFTPDMIVELLNSLENNDLFVNVELAYQTNKAIATEETDLDILIQEQEKQLFADMAANEEETYDALMLLHTLEVDEDSSPALTVQDYRKLNDRNNPKTLLDMPSYFTEVFTIQIRNQKLFLSLEDSVFLTDILQARKLAELKGMTKELKEIDDFLIVNLSAKPNLDIKEDSPFFLNSVPVIKLAAMMLRMQGSLTMINKLDNIITFIQPGLSKESRIKLKNSALTIVKTLSGIQNLDKSENQEYYYLAAARFEKMLNVSDDITLDKSFETLIIETAGNETNPKQRSLASAAIKKAWSDFKTVPEGMTFEASGINFRPDVAQFASTDKFIEAFGNDGENVVNQLNGLVTEGIISQKTMDMKLIMIGSLALSNKNILVDLHIEKTTDLGPSKFAVAAKKGTKYTIGLNINAMKVTPDNEILLKFAEELVHIARMKYLNVNDYDYRKLVGIFNTARAEPMIREMLLAMNKNKPYDLLEQDIRYAISKPDEFLAHFGAMILLQETIYNPEVLTALEAKYDGVLKAKAWWARAFHNIKLLAKQTINKFAQLKNDSYYGEVYTASYQVVQNLLFNSYPAGRLDIGNPDMEFNAFAQVTTTQQQLTPEQKNNIKQLRRNLETVEKQLQDPTLDASTSADLKTQKAEIETRLGDPAQNPKNIMDMREDEVQVQLDLVRRDGTGRIVERRRPDLATRALVSEALNNWSRKRGRRVDNQDTLGGLIRQLPDQSDKVTRLFQNYLFGQFNNINATYNSPEALAVMISDLIDNWTVTTQDSYRPSLTSGGFMANKLALDGYVGNLRYHTSTVGRNFTNRDARERIHNNAIRQLHGLEMNTKDEKEVEAVNLITKAFKLWHKRLGDEMVRSRIKESSQYLDPVGLKLRDAKLLTADEKTQGFKAIQTLLKKKTLRLLDSNKENAVISPYILFVGGLLADPEKKFSDQNEFEIIYNKVRTDPRLPATNAQEAIMKAIINRAIEKLARDTGNSIAVVASQMQGSDNIVAEGYIREATLDFIYNTRKHETTFSEALVGLSRSEIDMVLKEYRELVALNASSSSNNTRFNTMNNQDFGFYMGESIYANEFKNANTVMDAMTYEFLGKLGATAYLFDTRSPFLTSHDIFLFDDASDKELIDSLDIARKMFDLDIDSISVSLLRGVGYDAIQRIILEEVTGIPGFNFTVQQFIDMVRGLISSRNPDSKYRTILNLDEQGAQETRKHTILLALERLEEANKDARGTLGHQISGNPLIDTLVKSGRVAAQLSFGPNIGLATWLVEGGMGAVFGTVRGDNPFTFLLDAIDQNIGTFVSNTLGDVVRVRDNKVSMFNVDPPRVRNVAKNCLWLFEEMYSPMLPGKLTGDGFTSEIIDRMSTWERFMAWQGRSQSGAMKAIRVASENQANRRIVKDIQNKNLYKLRDSVNKILRDNPNPSNFVLRQILKDAGVDYNIEVLLAFIRSGLFEVVETKKDEKTVSKIGVLETIEYMMSQYQLDRGTLSLLDFFSEEQTLGEVIVRKFGKNTINQTSIRDARTAMMKAQKSYANMAMVMHHPLDGTASAKGHQIVLNFYKSYPALFTAQFLMRRGSVTPAMQFAFELLTYSLLDLSYNIILSLASGYYQYEKLKRALQNREINNREVLRLLLKYPIFSTNIIGLGMQNIIPALSGGMNKDLVISSVAESAIGYDIRTVIKALQGWSSFVTGEVPAQHPMISTYNAFGRIFPGIGNTLIKMLLMQSFGELNTSGRTPSKRSSSSYILDKIDAVSDQAIREAAVRDMFKYSEYAPAGKKSLTKAYQSIPNVESPQMKQPQLPEVKQPQLPEVKQPQLPTTPKEPGIVKQATTPIKAPM